MNRSFLERASWLAGIISALIALIVWVGSLPSHKQPTNSEQKSVPTVEDAKLTKEQPKKTLPELSENKVAARWLCNDIAQDLQPAFDAAKNITYYANKDDAMLQLARKALCIQNYQIFEKAASEISYYETRDQAYVDGVDFTLGLRKYDLAKKYAALISYYDTRDTAMTRIARKATQN